MSFLSDLPADLSGLGLAEIARLAEERKLPPVERWDPPHCGDSRMRIARDGTWFHEGSPIGRPAMVRLFSSILRREADGGFVLVTPVEKLAIHVEDAPFNAVELQTEGEGRERALAFRLNTGDVVMAGPDHLLRIEEREDGPHPYLAVRPGLEARIARPVYYELAEIALNEAAEPPGVWSAGAFFAMDAGGMSLAATLREALELGHRHSPVLIAGDVLEGEDVSHGITPAAVLVAVVERPQPTVILTLRPETMRKHPGQVSFPGGRIDPDDDGPIAAALREAEEEIGLPPSAVEVIGIADCYQTVTGFEVTPVVGIVPPGLTLSPHPGEVAAVFEAPLDYLLDPAHQLVRTAVWRGRERSYFEIEWEGRRIWGATAAMIVNLSRRLAIGVQTR